MTSEEKYIREKAGNRNPFRVPDDYFANFTSQMMEKLPEYDNRAILLRGSRTQRILRPLLYTAACICVAIFCLGIYFNNTLTNAGTDTQHTATASGNTSAYYTMEDDNDIYAYLSGE